MQAEWSAFSCFLPGRSENIFLDRPLSSPSARCQATWLWWFRGLPSLLGDAVVVFLLLRRYLT